MRPILTNPHLDSKNKRYTLINVVTPKLEDVGDVWEGNAKFVKQLETVHLAAALKIRRYSTAASNTVLRAELGTDGLKTN